MKQLAVLLLFTAHSIISEAQELSRRSFLGIRMENVTSDLQRVMELKDSSGVLISEVIPGSTAETAGFQQGDILLRINNLPTNDLQGVVAYVGSQKSNSSFTYELVRKRKIIKGKAVFKPYPAETYNDLDIVYTHAKTDAGLQRVIITRQKNKTNQPLIFFIGGIGCYSLDMPFDTGRSEIQLLNKLARAGYTTIRLEKPGMGDGAGFSTPCNEISFAGEVESYAAAINEIKRRKEFTSNKTYLIGHSMGGVMAPLVAGKTTVNGIIAYGTIGSNFIEYLGKTRRTIGEAYSWPPDETDSFVRDCYECAGYYFVEKMTTAEATMKKPICSEHLPVFDLRSRTYNDELYALNIPAAWKKYNGKALLAWGGSDYIAAKEDHEIITKAINYYHKGNASFVQVENADHGMNYATSFQEAQTNPGRYNPIVGNIFLDWLMKQS